MLRHELESRGVQTVSSHMAGPTQHGGPSQAPPALGHGPSNLFGGIMANQGGSAPGLAPLPLDKQPVQQHTVQQPAPVASGEYQPGAAAVNGMLCLNFMVI